MVKKNPKTLKGCLGFTGGEIDEANSRQPAMLSEKSSRTHRIFVFLRTNWTFYCLIDKILHTWGEEHKKWNLTCCYNSLPAGGTFLVMLAENWQTYRTYVARVNGVFMAKTSVNFRIQSMHCVV